MGGGGRRADHTSTLCMSASEGGKQDKAPCRWRKGDRRVAHTQHNTGKQTNNKSRAPILVVSTAGQLDSYPPPDS